MAPDEPDDLASLFERVGGRPFFSTLVGRFYDGVAEDPILRPMYPQELAPARERLELFLVQFFGGPDDYTTRRGAPMLRARHLPFPIDEAARDAWLTHMGEALDAAELDVADRDAMWRYFVQAANFFMNRGGLHFS